MQTHCIKWTISMSHFLKNQSICMLSSSFTKLNKKKQKTHHNKNLFTHPTINIFSRSAKIQPNCNKHLKYLNLHNFVENYIKTRIIRSFAQSILTVYLQTGAESDTANFHLAKKKKCALFLSIHLDQHTACFVL